MSWLFSREQMHTVQLLRILDLRMKGQLRSCLRQRSFLRRMVRIQGQQRVQGWQLVRGWVQQRACEQLCLWRERYSLLDTQN